MLENFIEYIWYLLTTPLKKVKKTSNKWYIFCQVFGKRFDELKEDILRARDEGMVSTCSYEMLPVHGADRGLVRYDGEDPENFRSRIAMFEEICKLGGTNEGVLLAVKTLGYEDVLIKTAKELCGDGKRWAEFYVLIRMEMGQTFPISFEILQKNVRQWKEVGAKDNYQFMIASSIPTNEKSDQCRAVPRLLCVVETKTETGSVHMAAAENQCGSGLTVNIKNNLWHLDGTYNLNGEKLMNAYERTEEIQ